MLTFKDKIVGNLTHSYVGKLQSERILSTEAVADIHRKLTDKMVLPLLTEQFEIFKKFFLAKNPGLVDEQITLDTDIATVSVEFVNSWNIMLSEVLLSANVREVCRRYLIELIIIHRPDRANFREEMTHIIDREVFITVRQERPIYSLESDLSYQRGENLALQAALNEQDGFMLQRTATINVLNSTNQELRRNVNELNGTNQELNSAVTRVAANLRESEVRFEVVQMAAVNTLRGLNAHLATVNHTRGLIQNLLQELNMRATWQHEEMTRQYNSSTANTEYTQPRSSDSYGFFNFFSSTLYSVWNYVGSFFWQTQVVVEPTVTPVNTNAEVINNQHDIENLIAHLISSESDLEREVISLTAGINQATRTLMDGRFIAQPVAVASIASLVGDASIESPVAVANDLTSSTVGVSIALNLISFSFVHRYWILLDIRRACFKIEMWYRNKRSN